MKTNIWVKTVGVVIVAILVQFKSPTIMLDRIFEDSPLSINFISTVFADEEVPPDSETGTVPETDSESDNNPNPEAEPNPKLDSKPDPTPEREPEKKPDSTPKPTPKPVNPEKPNQNPKPEAKPDLNKTPKPNPTTKPTQRPIKPIVKENSGKGTGTSKNTKKESNPVNTGYTNMVSQTENESQATINENNEVDAEEIETETEQVTEEEIEININELSIEQLINMLDKGELIWKANADKYLIMLTEGKGERELTTEEAIKLGIIDTDSEKDESVDDQDEVEETDDANEMTADNMEEVQLLSDNKNEKRKAPLYISAIGLITVLAGSLMYFIQWRKA